MAADIPAPAQSCEGPFSAACSFNHITSQFNYTHTALQLNSITCILGVYEVLNFLSCACLIRLSFKKKKKKGGCDLSSANLFVTVSRASRLSSPQVVKLE